MGRRIIFLIAAVSLIVSCTKTSIPETACDSHEIVVSIADSQIDTKSTVNIVGEPGNRKGKTSFSPGDELKVYDSNGNDAEYEYKSQRSGAGSEVFVFQNKIGQQIDTTKIAAACYPASWLSDYDNTDDYVEFDVKYPSEQNYTNNGTQTVSAPMVCFKATSNTLVFSNISCLLRIGVNCASGLENEVVVNKISVDINNSKKISLNGVYKYYWIVADEEVMIECPSFSKIKAMNIVSLSGCESAGAISTDTKFFYIILPPLSDCEDYKLDQDIFTVKVYFVGGKSKSYSFTTTDGGIKNQITKNTILDFPPITINPSDLL